MSLHTLNISSKPSEFKNLRKDIAAFLSDNKNYIVNFYTNQPGDNILNANENIVINAEYPLIGKILISFTESHSNFKFGPHSASSLLIAKWSVLSQENSEQSVLPTSSK